MMSVGQMLPCGVLNWTCTPCWLKSLRSSSDGLSGPLLVNFVPSLSSPLIDPSLLFQSIDLTWSLVAFDTTSEYGTLLSSSAVNNVVLSSAAAATPRRTQSDQRGRLDGDTRPGARG